jgi:hypothetical protein
MYTNRVQKGDSMLFQSDNPNQEVWAIYREKDSGDFTPETWELEGDAARSRAKDIAELSEQKTIVAKTTRGIFSQDVALS